MRLRTSIYNLKKNNKGSATVVALIAGVVILAFAMSLMLVAYSLYTQINRQNIQEQCRQISESTAVSLETELASENNRLAEYLKEQRLLENDRKWIPVVEADEDEFNPTGGNSQIGREELEMRMRLSDSKLENYIIEVTFTYTEDEAYDDEEEDEEETSPSTEPQQNNAVRVLHAKIRTSRGTEAGRDFQESIVEKDYRNIDF